MMKSGLTKTIWLKAGRMFDKASENAAEPLTHAEIRSNPIYAVHLREIRARKNPPPVFTAFLEWFDTPTPTEN